MRVRLFGGGGRPVGGGIQDIGKSMDGGTFTIAFFFFF